MKKRPPPTERRLDRLARAYEADPDKRQDLLQEIHLALWRSFEHFAQRCSLRTWVYQVAHNVAASQRRPSAANLCGLVSLEEIESMPVHRTSELAVDRHTALERLLRLIQRLKPPGSAGNPLVPGRHGCRVDRRDYGDFGGQCGDEDLPV